MCLPNFIICGAAKSATTSLFSALNQHPSIYMPRIKEVDFFSHRYTENIETYKDYFLKAKNNQIIGEASPDYMFVKGSAKKIKKHLPDVKLIFILRNPVDRAYSNYLHKQRDGEENRTFEVAINEELMSLQISHEQNLKYGYLERGFYSRQLESFYNIFDKNQIMIIRFEEIEDDINIVCSRIFKWIQVDSMNINKSIVFSNSASSARFQYLNKVIRGGGVIKKIVIKILPRKIYSPIKWYFVNKNLQQLKNKSIPISVTKVRMMKIFDNEIERLSNLTGINFNTWRN
jgi:hypothetical protein